MSTPTRAIVVPLDGSRVGMQAIGLALQLAGPSGTVHLVRVVPTHPSDFSVRIRHSSTLTTHLHHLALEEADQFLAVAAKQGHKASQIEIHLLEGDPAEQILRLAHHIEADQIVMSTHGRGALGRLWYGSVTDRVVREATIPVTAIRAQGEFDPPLPTRIVFATDGSDLAQRAFPIVAMLSKVLNAPIHIVTAVDPIGDLTTITGGAVLVSKSLFAESEVDIAQDARAALRATRLALENEGLSVTSELLEGNPSGRLIAAIQPTDLAVMTSHGRGGITRWALGSVADRVMRSARGPVTIVPNVGARSGKAPLSPTIVRLPVAAH
ncbi:MAG TPA: universal stress protein [Thermomicrobiales bacterium]|mgnify:CR=1 FL=1|nr:universal stress protein [Thermomicrobiales bacterium]